MAAHRKDEIQRQFACAKCHGRACTAQEVTLATPVLGVLPLPGSVRYVAVSCSLCGFTEFFSLAVAAGDEARSPASPELADSTDAG